MRAKFGLFFTLLAACTSAASGAAITIPANATYTISESVIAQALPVGCESNAFTTYKWYKNSVLTGVTTPEYLILPGSQAEGQQYTLMRTVMCAGCPPVLRSEPIVVNVGAPVQLAFDCAATQVFGVYVPGRAVSAANYIRMKVNNPQSLALPWKIVTLPNNGLRFSGEGTLSAGDNFITLHAQGTPASTQVTTFTINADESNIYGAAMCAMEVRVTNPPTFACSATQVKSRLLKGVAAGDSTYIQMQVNSPLADLPWKITTDTVNGISFSGSGTLAGGINSIRIYASGTPTKTGLAELHISEANTNIYGATVCPIKVYVPIKLSSIVFYTHSRRNNDWDMMANGESCHSAFINMARGRTNRTFKYFDTDTLVRAYYILATGLTGNGTTMSDDDHIVILGYNVDLNTATTDNRNQLNAIVHKVKNRKGVVVLQAGSDNSTRVDLRDWLRANFDANIDIDDNNYIDRRPFVAGSPVTSGPVFNLSGMYYGTDGDGNQSFTNVDPNKWWILVGTTASARAIMHKQYPLIIMGDGGALTGGTYNERNYQSGYYHPVWTDENGQPMAKQISTGTHFRSPVHNSYFYINILVWALQQLADN